MRLPWVLDEQRWRVRQWRQWPICGHWGEALIAGTEVGAVEAEWRWRCVKVLLTGGGVRIGEALVRGRSMQCGDERFLSDAIKEVGWRRYYCREVERSREDSATERIE